MNGAIVEEMAGGEQHRVVRQRSVARSSAARASSAQVPVFGYGLALVMLGCAVQGCVVNEPESPTRGVVVSGPPPAPMREETRPPPPNPHATWVAGYWHWTGLRYAWIPGHWEAPPAGAVWNAPRVTVQDGRYVYESGGWKNGSQRAVR